MNASTIERVKQYLSQFSGGTCFAVFEITTAEELETELARVKPFIAVREEANRVSLAQAEHDEKVARIRSERAVQEAALAKVSAEMTALARVEERADQESLARTEAYKSKIRLQRVAMVATTAVSLAAVLGFLL